MNKNSLTCWLFQFQVQVAVFAFDLLYLNGEALVKEPFKKRRELLKDHFKEVEGEFLFAKYADPDNLEDIQEVLEQSVKGMWKQHKIEDIWSGNV